MAVGIGRLWRFFRRHALTLKKASACLGTEPPEHPEAPSGGEGMLT
jgi:hypothetical protein